MEIMRVTGSLVCTRRVPGLGVTDLRLLCDASGGLAVATDTVGASPGSWVFTVSGSAARYAVGDPALQTDLAIGGIIDDWDDDPVT
ncbi:carboxysome peptide B [Roseospira navarrensis]|uniref:Carboxysome peptide B n=1 Tax=Roseospira navarrensis TaxID=140058 RepID=A0A7X1ZF14_9PROT|nr:carboxysome peptide B [Roseospira navarrensis]MQX37370.1 carboxysome peptide B [Roseospira navarrensis]